MKLALKPFYVIILFSAIFLCTSCSDSPSSTTTETSEINVPDAGNTTSSSTEEAPITEESKPEKSQCITCVGTGKVNQECGSCHGAGKLAFEKEGSCNSCGGSGTQTVACKSCDGDGWVNDDI